MENFDFGFDFGDFGMESDDFFSMGEKKPKKEEPKKAEQKKKEQKKVSAGEDTAVTCPLTVKARTFSVVIEEGVTKLSEVADKLVELGFKELSLDAMKLFYIDAVKTVYVDDTSLTASGADTAVFLQAGEDATVTVACGGYNTEITASDFPEKEADEVSIKDCAEFYGQQNPTYVGQKNYYFDITSAVLYPTVGFCSLIQADTIDVIVNGESKEVEVGGRKPDEIAKELAGDMAGAKAELRISGEKYFLCYSAGKIPCFSKGGGKSTSSGKEVKTVKEKYELPFSIYVYQIGLTIPVTSEDFEGKQKVQQSDVETFLKAHRQTKMFASSSERKVSLDFSKEEKLLVVGFNSSKKGATSEAEAMLEAEERYESPWHTGEFKMIRDVAELVRVKQMESFYGHYTGGGESFIVRAMPVGNFYGHTRMARVERVTYEHKLPKLPRAVLDNVISIFREDLSKEAVVRIIYNRKTGETNIVVPNLKVVSKVGVEADYSDIIHLYLDKNVVTVCEIHSHNTMPAFWSSTDDADEAAYPGIFGVIGNLDNEEPSMKFRASFEGVFGEISAAELFEM